jgi:S1-C subfamily serine protease
MAKNIILLFLILIGACKPASPDDIIKKYRPAVGMLIKDDSSCSTFHVGKGFFVTAKHCVDGTPAPELTIKDYQDNEYDAQVLYSHANQDVAILITDEEPGVSFEVLTKLDPEPEVGQEVMTMGHPGYYLTDFMFEVGYINGTKKIGDSLALVSKDISFPGESGGPVVSLASGKVIGMAVAMLVPTEDNCIHQHNTISIIVPWDVIQNALAHGRLEAGLLQ